MVKRSILEIIKDMLQVLVTFPAWFFASVLSTALVVGVEPSIVWFGKKFVDDLKKGNSEFNLLLPQYILLFGGLLFGQGILKFGDKLIDKIYELKLVISLQKLYLNRRLKDGGVEDISRIIIDSEMAKKGLDIIHKDAGKIIFTIISVLVWQLKLAPQWLPALLISVTPPMLIGFLFGRFIQSASLGRLVAQQNLATSTNEAKRLEFYTHQDQFLQHSVRLEIFKSSTEILMDLVTWFGLLMIVLLDPILPFQLVPPNIQAGDLVLFIGNLNLLSKPLGEVVKVYNKFQESYPAMLRVFYPEDQSDSLESIVTSEQFNEEAIE